MIATAAEIERNKEAIKILLDVTRTLVHQGLVLCGSAEEHEVNSNFNQFVQLVSRHVPSSNDGWMMPQNDVMLLSTSVQSPRMNTSNYLVRMYLTW